MAHFRSISLCNILYKIVSKVLANRLKKVMNSFIDEGQSAFLPSRLNTNNTTIAFEVFHIINGSTSRNDPHMALKLDMSNAFDQVEWRFLEILI